MKDNGKLMIAAKGIIQFQILYNLDLIEPLL